MNAFRSKKAQAILELAIFGSIILMLMGIILNYALRYGLQQKATMSAFRKALGASSNEAQGGQASYTLIQDKHVPNPSNPFAVGSVTSVFSSASIVRSYKLNEVPELGRPEELPSMTIEIQGTDNSKSYTYKTAAFRCENNVPKDSKDRYNEVYGYVCFEEECGATDGECLEWGYSPYTGLYYCAKLSKNITIMDSCEGEIINYDACKRQCRMMTDNDYCRNQCERGKQAGSDRNCAQVCSQEINAPWYCGSLDDIFNFAIAKNKRKAMGVQADYSKSTEMRNKLVKTEELGGLIRTEDTIDWTDTTYRDIVYLDHVDSGTGLASPATRANLIGDEPGEPTNRIPNIVSENTTCVNAECN